MTCPQGREFDPPGDILAERRPDEVNFWRPSSSQDFKAIPVGAPFLFKLHSPQNFIVGGGFFVNHSTVPLSLAWKAFLEKNGAPDFPTFRRLIQSHRQTREIDPVIGCTVLGEPFFFTEHEWIPAPEDWAPSIMRGKTYDTEAGEGRRLWEAVQERLRERHAASFLATDRAVSEDRYGKEYLARPRLGQGGFRILVTEAYGRRCAMTGEKILPVLEAAHIKRFSMGGPHAVSNGILLRSDLHILFDDGYVTVTPDFHIEVSPRLKEDFDNGKEYYRLHGRVLSLPQSPQLYPSAEYIEWHNGQ